MEKIRFLLYYIKLRLSAGLGIHKIPNPLDIRWRWSHWQNIKAARRKRR